VGDGNVVGNGDDGDSRGRAVVDGVMRKQRTCCVLPTMIPG